MILQIPRASHIQTLLSELPCDLKVYHLRRSVRTGFKAGALQQGLLRSSAELFAIFDADFLPPRNFLKDTGPYFRDSRARVRTDAMVTSE